MQLDFKIGMIAPSKAGKTSLMTAIFHEMKKKLSGNAQGIQYWADSKATQNAISRAIAEFTMCTASDDVFEVPRLAGTESASNYKFAFTVPVEAGTQRLNIDIMDYPGGLLGTPEFEDTVRPHLDASSVLLVPIPADVLMEWHRTNGVNNTHAKKVNIKSQCMLEAATVVDVVKDWAKRRAMQRDASLLLFVPIRCEAYFDDNGGSKNESEILHEAVEKLYIGPLNLSAEEKAMVHIETHAVDTYGIVELRDISLMNIAGSEELVSTFRKRLSCGNEISAKGAFEVLASVIRFRLNRYAKQLGMRREQLENDISERSIFSSIWNFIFGDKEKQAVVEYIRQYDGAFQAMSMVSKLSNDYVDRQKTINALAE